MKRGMTTVLAAVTFIAGHFAATACQASMSIPAPRESKAEHSCCSHKAPATPKAPSPRACCCVDGAHLAVVVEDAPAPDSAECSAPDAAVLAPVDLALPVFTGGRAPPGPAPGVLLYTLHATLLI